MNAIRKYYDCRIKKTSGDKMKKNKIRSKPISQKDSFRNSTAEAIKICKFINNKEIRKDTIAVIKAVNGKRVRNTSGV